MSAWPQGVDGWIAAVVLYLGTAAFLVGCGAAIYFIWTEGFI